MKELFERLCAALARGEDAALCSILGASGSSPRGLGAKMAVFQDGATLGTVGGGAVESQAQRAALEALQNGRSSMHSFQLTRNDIADIGMVCGGNVRIYVQVFQAADAEARAQLERIRCCFSSLASSWLVLAMDGERVTQMGVYRNDGGVQGLTIDEKALRPMLQSHPAFFGGSPAYYTEPLVQAGIVYIFGGGHVGRELAPVLAHVGFRVTLLDSRPELAKPENYPGTERVICGDFLHLSDYVTIQPEDYVVVVTPSHVADREVLQQALATDATYIGCIGSHSKLAVGKAWLLEHGVTEENYARVHAPIGLPIGGRTPEEIAISIAAELIQHRASIGANRK